MRRCPTPCDGRERDTQQRGGFRQAHNDGDLHLFDVTALSRRPQLRKQSKPNPASRANSYALLAGE